MSHVDVDMDDILICKDTWNDSAKVVYTIITNCAQFLLPVVLVIPLYCAIYLKLKNRPQVSTKNTIQVLKTFEKQQHVLLQLNEIR